MQFRLEGRLTGRHESTGLFYPKPGWFLQLH
jgi:hypothetical protein